jgi:hypothetical protein
LAAFLFVAFFDDEEKAHLGHSPEFTFADYHGASVDPPWLADESLHVSLRDLPHVRELIAELLFELLSDNRHVFPFAWEPTFSAP